MKTFLSVLFSAAILAACLTDHKVGFGPGDPWVTTAPTGLLANYPGAAAAPTLRALDGGLQTPTINCVNDGNPATLTFTSAGLDIGDSGIVGNACGGVINLFFDGGVITTSTALATVNMPFYFNDAGQGGVFNGAGGAVVDCQHGNGLMGLVEGPVELGTQVYCRMITGDGGNAAASNQFNIYEGPNPLAATGILGLVAHDAGAGLFQVQYHVVGTP